MNQQQITNEIGKRLRECRMKLNLSQAQVGEQIGVTFQQIQKYERGVNRISATRLYVFCEVNEIDIGEFFKEVGNG